MNDGVVWFFDNPNIAVFLSFTIKITAPHLKEINYSDYQKELWEIIREKHDSGMGYRRISYWLNEHGYKTPRGHEFKNTHVFSILKNKRIADKRIEKRFKSRIENLKIRIYNFKISLS